MVAKYAADLTLDELRELLQQAFMALSQVAQEPTDDLLFSDLADFPVDDLVPSLKTARYAGRKRMERVGDECGQY